MDDCFVSCHTPDDIDLDRRIQGLGFSGPPDPAVRQWLDIDSIIALIESGRARFLVDVDGVRTRVIVARHGAPHHRKYLTTVADDFPANNLLKLPRC